MRIWALNVVIAADQMVNALLRGDPDETLSSRAYRMHMKGQPYWGGLANVIDWFFFWDADHCRKAFESEQLRRFVPDEHLAGVRDGD